MTDLKKAQEMKDILKNMVIQGERLRELGSSIPVIKDEIARGTQDIGELSIDMIYIICDYIGSKTEGGE